MPEARMLRVALDWSVDEIDPPRSFGGWNTGRVVQQTHESLVEDDFHTPPCRLMRRLGSCRVWPSRCSRRRCPPLHLPLAPGSALPRRRAARCRGGRDELRTHGVPGFAHYSAVVADLNREGVGLIERVRAL